jgi:hypothetical protein
MRITGRQALAVSALLQGRTQSEAAQAAKVSSATLRRWSHDANFMQAVRVARGQVVEAAIGQLQRASARAVKCLIRNLGCGKPSAEIRAAEVLLTQALRGVELFDLALEIDKLKAAVNRGDPK